MFVLLLVPQEFMSVLHHQSSPAEAENRQEEQNSDQEGNQSCKRKRSSMDKESDLDMNRTHHFSVLRIAFVLFNQILDLPISF